MMHRSTLEYLTKGKESKWKNHVSVLNKVLVQYFN
jgi:hypothetical protein